ncbi:LrgB family protein [Bacillus testis]|uniref:LrgB family protein n=1 Tax=Bacillus testis TaxID=1622072 RepID=UPI00067F025F|nr:LrgB family protein [Bacillus testis]
MTILLAILFIAATVLVFLLCKKIYFRYTIPLLLPILTTTFILVLLLVLFHIPYKTYMIGGQYINMMLGPAVVSLAFPLYKQRKTIAKYMVPIIGGVVTGVVGGMLSGILLGHAAGLTRNLLVSIMPKSLTTPVAVQVATSLGGVPAMTALFVMIAGLSGAIFGPYILRFFRIESLLGKGIALGSASHALGTTKAAEYGELPFSMSSVAMTLSAIMGSIIGPVLIWMMQI